MKQQRYWYHRELDYFPITAHLKGVSSSYAIALTICNTNNFFKLKIKSHSLYPFMVRDDVVVRP